LSRRKTAGTFHTPSIFAASREWSSIRRRTLATLASVCGRREPRGRGETIAAGSSLGGSGRTLRRVMEEEL